MEHSNKRSDRSKKQRPPKKTVLSGVIQITRSGRGFLIQEENDIPIPRDYVRGALSGDIVEVQLTKGRFETIGVVKRIIERKTSSFVGVLIDTPQGVMLKPDNNKVYMIFRIVDTEHKGTPLPIGYKVIVDVIDWEDEHPKAKIRSILGVAGDHETEMHAIIAERGFDSTFSKAVLDEAEQLYEKKWDEKEIASREDFRDVLTITIDPPDAKDFDDAISLKELSDGNVEVGIHIADVSHFVRKGGAIDQEALRRGTSVYLVDRTIPMLPPQLSEDLCSLRPDEDRLTFSAVFTVSPENTVVGRRFGKGIIRSTKRFTYDDADKALKDTKAPYHKELSKLWALASRLRNERKDSGAIMFDSEEIKPILNDKHEVVEFRKIQYTESHQMIEELMLLANREVAGFVSQKLGKKNRFFVYRIHDIPKAERVENLLIFLRAMGYDVSFASKEYKDGQKVLSGNDINSLLQKADGQPEEALVRTATIRSMAKAIYTTKNIGHYGLAFEEYAHFTSPIRRYPDLMVHRTLFSVLKGERIAEDPDVVEKQAIHSSEREAVATDAERTSIKMKQLEYFQKLIGEKRDGVVSGVADWGVYVVDNETGAEGMIRLANMTDDTYEHDPQKYAVVGIKTKNVIRIGDAISFVVESVSLEEMNMDLKLAS